MIAQINAETQAVFNFGRARRRAMIRRVRNAVRKDTISLPAFEEVRRSLGFAIDFHSPRRRRSRSRR